MEKYEIIPHTSDVRLKVNGLNMEELFRNALEGMNSIINGEKIQKKDGTIADELESFADDASLLLVDFLSGILTLTHTKKAIFDNVRFSSLNENYFKAEISGFPVNGFDEDIKAVTYSETNIVKNIEGYFEAIILFDI
ncbi:MAG: archease [Ignavibacteria bacterium]